MPRVHVSSMPKVRKPGSSARYRRVSANPFLVMFAALVALAKAASGEVMSGSDLVFWGVVANGTHFNSSEALPIFPGAYTNAVGPVGLTTSVDYHQGFPNTYCQINFPDGTILPFNHSMPAARKDPFESAAALAEFGQKITLNCSAASAALLVIGQVEQGDKFSVANVSTALFDDIPPLASAGSTPFLDMTSDPSSKSGGATPSLRGFG